MNAISTGPAIPVVLALALFGLAGCAGQSDSGDGEGDAGGQMEAIDPAMGAEGEQGEEGAEGGEEHGEEDEHAGHDHAPGEGHDDEHEESGEYIARDADWDETRRGIRLMLSFDADDNAFTGSVQNTTGATVCGVRVEIHLSNGTEIGPTDPVDLPSGETLVVALEAGDEDFETYNAHPEVSAC